MAENVFDLRTGKHLLVIDNGEVICLATGSPIASIKDSSLYDLDGSLICYLQDVPVGYGTRKPIPDPLQRLMRQKS